MVQMLKKDNVDYMITVPDNSFDWGIVDIEYLIGASKPSVKNAVVKQKNGSSVRIKQSRHQHKDWDFKKSGDEYFQQLFRITKNQIIFGGNYYGLSGGYLVWDKLNGECDQFGCELAWLSFTKRTDIVYYLWSGMMQGEYCGKDVKKALRQIGNKKLNEKRIHPCQKPVKLYAWILNEYCKKGDKIFDSHGGSMSLGIACEKLGFDCVICENDEDTYNDAVARFKEETNLGLFNGLNITK